MPLLFLFIVFYSGNVLAGSLNHTEIPLKTVRVVMDDNYPPYVFKNDEGTVQGILIDQWRLFEKKTGIRVELTPMDWGGAIKGMKAGRFDVIDTIFKTSERIGWLDFTEPYTSLKVPVFFNGQISGISDAKSLRGFAVAAKEGDAAVEILQSHGVTNLLLFSSYEEIIRAAKDHRVNIFVIDEPPALYFLYKFGIREKYKESAPLYVGEFHRAVKKNDISTLRAIQEGFKLISPVELQQIDKKWLGTAIPSFFQTKVLAYIFLAVFLIILLILVLFLWNRSLRKAVGIRTQALRTSEERYRHLFNAESDAIVVIDVETLTHVEVNEAAIALYGYSPEEILQLHPTDLSAEPEETSFPLGNGQGTIRIPLRYHKKSDGTVFPVEIFARFFELDGRQRLLAAIRDISERLRAEEALRENRRFLRDLIENSGALIFVKELDGRYTLINRQWEKVTGFHRQTVLGRTDEELFPGRIGEQFRRNDLAVIEAGKVQEKEEILEDENGRRYFLSIKFPLRNAAGGINGICGMTTEITERRIAEEEQGRLREELAQARKMESIGRLAGGIAHDFNNMLGVILGHTELALLKVPGEAPLRNNLSEIDKAARRSAELTRRLLAFARKQTVIPKILDLNEIVDSMHAMLGRLIGENIDFIWSPGENLWPIKMDPSQIDQILANLCANAKDAINNVGKVVISTANRQLSATFCRSNEGCREGDFVVLSVADSGCGMSQKTLANLFEPFYTTKEVGKGTGLGLATVYGIVQQNGGFITVDSEVGKGSCFSIFLPRHNDPLGIPPQALPVKELSLGTETILVVEDEPAILNMTCEMLNQIGYRVMTANAPMEAIRIMQNQEGRIDLLITDVIMPLMNGWELAQSLQHIQPTIKLLFTSGYTADAIAQHNVLAENIHFLQKPFTMQELSDAVRLAMDKNG